MKILSLLILAFLSLALIPIVDATLRNETLACYQGFNADGEWIDWVNGSNATPKGNAGNTNLNCPLGFPSCATFDGAGDYYNISTDIFPKAKTLQQGGIITVFNGSGHAGNVGEFITMSTTGATYAAVHLFHETSVQNFNIDFQDTATQRHCFKTSGNPGGLLTNQEYHLMFLNSGDYYSVIINGTNLSMINNCGAGSVNNGTWYGHTVTTLDTFTIGASLRASGFENEFKGKMSMMLILNQSNLSVEKYNETFNGTSGVLNCTQILGTTAVAEPSDTTIPIINASLNSSTIRINNVVNLTANTTDETGLSSCTFGINQTGSTIFYNKSVTGTSDKCSQNFTISATRGALINFSVTSNDTSSNKNLNSTLITVADTLGSITIGNNVTSIRKNDVINITSNITEADGDIAFGWIKTNMTGVANYTFAGSGSNFNFSQNITINVSRGNVINFSVYYNDTAGTIIQNSFNITVTNTIPNGTNFVNITGKHYSRNVSINWTPSDNPDNDILRYVVFSDATNPPTALYYNGTDLNLTTNWTSDNTYFYQIKVMDDISESALSPVFNLTLDTGLPTLTTNCTNNTVTRFNQTCLFSIEDPFPYNLSVLVNKNGNDYHIKTNSTAVGRFINITFLLNLTEDGNYTIYVNASDSDKTSPVISDKLSNWKVKNELLSFNTSKGKGINLDIKFKGNAPPSNFNSFTYFNDKGTHLIFGVNYTANATNLLPVFNVKDNGINIAYLNDSIKGHFVFHPYGIDFEGKVYINNIEKDYNVSVKKISSVNYQVEIIPNAAINIGDNITFISESVFGLNTIDVFYNLVNDQTLPNILNITPINNTSTSTDINFTANITEINPDKMELWINSTGTWHLNRTASYQNNITSNFSLFNLSDGIYKWTVCANDTAGGRSCFAENYSITIDTSPPSITLNSPFNNTVQTFGEPPNVNFRISGSEIVKNCSLFLSGEIVGNESTQKQSHNFTVSSIAGGNYRWNATCYDLANNLGISGIFNLEIRILSGGSGVTPSPSGGGIGVPPLLDETGKEIETIDRGYTMTYICGKVRKLLDNTPNYDLSSIVLLQEDIRFEINLVIPFTTLKGYVDNYENFCGAKKEIKPEREITQPSAKSMNDRFLNLTKFNLMTYIKFPFQIDFGKIKDYGKNALGFLDFVNIFLPLSVSDDISSNPNIIWEGGVRVIPMLATIILIVVVVSTIKIFHSKKKMDVLSNIESLKKKEESRKKG